MNLKSYLFVAALVCGAAAYGQVPGLEVKGPYSSLKRNKDGSYEEFTRTPGVPTIQKELKDASGVVRTKTVYRLSPQGNPLTCDIFDGKGNRLFKTRYGYDKRPGSPTFSLLLEEEMFDARVKRKDPRTGQEMPVRKFIYSYDAQGNRNAPVAFTLIPGKYAKEVFGPSALEFDPFEGATLPKGERAVNPSAKRVGTPK
ncbi:hypothetical protein [Luteolibacter luteus]|uniref:Uncharacterized protein n=1 Tax=Luteolibacter luteus TaxID=2728835 RepID=A0A858RGJ7_9BACT|nr:hypothetical protein [Luteolibacter luteus]QJE95658.1 hypothetical protein HHL09_07625 [Luteolibacter luteus]